LTAADITRILRWEYCFTGDPCDVFIWYLLFWNVSGSNRICSKSGHMFHIVSTCIPKL